MASSAGAAGARCSHQTFDLRNCQHVTRVPPVAGAHVDRRIVKRRVLTSSDSTIARDRSRRLTCRAGAFASSEQATGRTAWYEKQQELWLNFKSRADMAAAAAALPPGKLLALDFYAPWCAVCKGGYPALCRIAADPKLTQHFVFAKASIDDPDIKAILKSEGIVGIPWISVYAPAAAAGSGDAAPAAKLVGFGASFKRLEMVRKNLGAVADVLRERGPAQLPPLVLDPNGFVMVAPAGMQQHKQATVVASL